MTTYGRCLHMAAAVAFFALFMMAMEAVRVAEAAHGGFAPQAYIPAAIAVLWALCGFVTLFRAAR